MSRPFLQFHGSVWTWCCANEIFQEEIDHPHKTEWTRQMWQVYAPGAAGMV